MNLASMTDSSNERIQGSSPFPTVEGASKQHQQQSGGSDIRAKVLAAQVAKADLEEKTFALAAKLSEKTVCSLQTPNNA